jgi:hypothetical protein
MPYAFPLTVTFTGYTVEDVGIRLSFVAATPGPGMPTDLEVAITDSELAAVTTQQQLRTLVESELNRKLRATNIASKLDPFIGQTLVVN